MPKRKDKRRGRNIFSRAVTYIDTKLSTPEVKDHPIFGGYNWQQSLVQTPGKPVWSPREYDKFADEAYIRNVIAFRAISMIAQGAASVNWKLYQDAADTQLQHQSHPILTVLNNPNPSANGCEFFEGLYTYRLISGNAFIQAVGPDRQPPRELHLLRPDRVTVIAGKNCIPQAYQYSVDKLVRTYPVNRVTGQSAIMHLKAFHPLSDWHGLAPVEAAAYSIDQHNQAAVWNQALLQNGARPSGALVVKGEALSDDQYTRLKGQVDDQFSGATNAGRPLLLEGGLDWKEMSLSPKDMDFIETKNSAARDIALAFGVPPQLLGIPGDNTYNNLAEARLALWEQTILPLVENTACAFNNWLVPMFGKEYRLKPDTDNISALLPRREKVWARVERATFLTVNEKRQALGYPPILGADNL